MLIPPLALILGAIIGLLVRRRPRLFRPLALATPVLSLLALAAQFVPGGMQRCTSSLGGQLSCEALPAVAAWSGPVPYAIAAALVLLSLGPLLAVRTGSRVPVAAAALLQAVPHVISFGGFVAWGPALLPTVAVAFAVPGTGRLERA